MIRRPLRVILACLPLAVPALSQGFHRLPIENGKDTGIQQFTLRLAGPDNPEKPTRWEGPLTIARGGQSCTADVSLVSSMYGSADRSFVIVISGSGSNVIVHFVELDSCRQKWPAMKRAASAVKVERSHLSFFPVCEGGGSNAPALCTSARVYQMEDDAAPVYLKSDSYKLTRRELGVGFSGEARVMDPRTPRAILEH